jgi:nucleoside-diphosphate-sugar epimerase
MTKISIIGLGWIGLPTATILANTHHVIGSTTSAEKATELTATGIHAIHFELIPFPKGKGFQQLFSSEILVVNIPPKSRTSSGEYYLEQIRFLRSMVDQSAIKKVIFISSTSVYPKVARFEPYLESEKFDTKQAGNDVIYQSELLFSKERNYDLTILRFGGLIGEDRVPGKYVVGKEDVVGHTRVNYIYRMDAVGVIAWIIEKSLWNQTYNGVAPVHSHRKEVFDKNVEKLGLEPPKSYQASQEGVDRIISGGKIIATGFEFLYPDPLDFPYNNIH